MLIIALFLAYEGFTQKHKLVVSDDISYNTWRFKPTGIYFLNLFHNPNIAIRSKITPRFSLEYGLGLRSIGRRAPYAFMLWDKTFQKVILKDESRSVTSFLNVMYSPLSNNPNWLISGLVVFHKGWRWEEKNVVNGGTTQNYVKYIQENALNDWTKIGITAGIGSEYNFRTAIGQLGVGVRGEIGLYSYDPKVVTLSLRYLIPIQKQNK